MKIFLNDLEKEIEPGTTLLKLLQDLEIHHHKGKAIAINGEVISSTEWPSTHLNESDRILMIQAIQGG